MMDLEKRRTLVVELVSLAAQGKLTLDTEAVFPLSEIQDAVKAALIPGRKGKVLLRRNEDWRGVRKNTARRQHAHIGHIYSELCFKNN